MAAPPSFHGAAEPPNQSMRAYSSLLLEFQHTIEWGEADGGMEGMKELKWKWKI